MTATRINPLATAFVVSGISHKAWWLTNSSMSGNMMMKYNSSRKEVAMTIAELFPTPIPSLCTKRIARLVPPIAEGLTAEVNSQRNIIRRDWNQFSFPPDRILIRITYPKSRIAMHRTATNNQNTVLQVKVIRSNALGSNSLYNM